jgi:hypothetical protein
MRGTIPDGWAHVLLISRNEPFSVCCGAPGFTYLFCCDMAQSCWLIHLYAHPSSANDHVSCVPFVLPGTQPTWCVSVFGWMMLEFFLAFMIRNAAGTWVVSGFQLDQATVVLAVWHQSGWQCGTSKHPHEARAACPCRFRSHPIGRVCRHHSAACLCSQTVATVFMLFGLLGSRV